MTTDTKTSVSAGARRVMMGVEISVYSLDVHLLLGGGKFRHEIRDTPSFRKTAGALNHLGTETAADNPFAENALIELEMLIEDLLDLAGEYIKKCETQQRFAAELGGFAPLPMKRETPYTHTFNHLGEHAKLLGRALGRVDRAICWIRAVPGAFDIEREEVKGLIRGLVRRSRAIFHRAAFYYRRMQHVTRDDVRKRRPNAVELATKLNGVPCQEVLNGQLRCKYRRVGLLGMESKQIQE